MKKVLWLAHTLALLSIANAQDPGEPARPTWQNEIAKGFVPYNQLTVDDFKVDDHLPAEGAYRVRPFIHYYYRFLLKPYNGFSYAYVTDWSVFSGLDKNATARKSKFREMKAELPYAQAQLDICELHARALAALKPGELPGVRAESYEKARAELDVKIKAFCEPTFQRMKAEGDAFAKATGQGGNRKKVRELAKEIRKRLEAIPVPVTSPNDLTPSATPTPGASANSPTPAAK